MPENGLVGLQELAETLEAVLLTPYIAHERPVSLLIVSKPEAGKTQMLKLYRSNKGIVYLTDATAYGLVRDVLPKLVNGEVKTIMIADLITPLSRSTKTRKNFVAFLNNLVEEGVAKVTTYSTVWEREVKANVVTAVTDEEIKDGRHEWAKMGFLSRFLIFSYSYPLDVVRKIFEFYSVNPPQFAPVKLKIPNREVDVHLPREIADKLDPLATAIGQKLGLYGFRCKVNFRSLLKAFALRNGRREVEPEDLENLYRKSRWFNLDLNPI